MQLLVKQAEEERDLANDKFEEEERRHQKTCAQLAELQQKLKEVCVRVRLSVYVYACVSIRLIVCIHACVHALWLERSDACQILVPILVSDSCSYANPQHCYKYTHNRSKELHVFHALACEQLFLTNRVKIFRHSRVYEYELLRREKK